MNWIQSEILSGIKGVVHGFSNREFNGDLSEVANFFGLDRIVTLNQVHSSDVLFVRDGVKDELEYEGDSLITNLKGVGIGVFTADCVPIVLADRDSTIVVSVHAGWRGTHSEILKNTLAEIKKNFGVQASEILAAIGPCIGNCCYEIGEDVASLFIDKFNDSGRYLSRKSRSKYILDLKEANKTALLKEGVTNIEISDFCTKCNPDFHSYRRDGKGVGKQLSFIGLI